MSPDTALWASQQLKKITGKDDLTLLEFCMSLTDASEIRQYIAAYLGSTPQVSSFATEFLQRKQRGRGGVTKAAIPSQVQVVGMLLINLVHYFKSKKTHQLDELGAFLEYDHVWCALM
ncbi:unnamed protein product [Choristocarpus tenellus]